MAVDLEIGQIVEGTVTGITHFGAFVALPNGKTGLVHISEVADAYVRDIKEYVKENDKVKVKVLSMDPNGKVGLSMKQAQPAREGVAPSPREARPPREWSSRSGGGGGSKRNPGTFEDKLQRFMRDSEDRLQDLKRNTESKRGGRGASR